MLNIAGAQARAVAMRVHGWMMLSVVCVAAAGGQAAVQIGDIIVTDAASAIVLKVDPTNGGQQLIASGGFLSEPTSIAQGHDGLLYVSDGLSGVIRIDPADGAQSLLASGGFLAGLHLNKIITDPTTGDLIVSASAASATPSVVRVHPITGTQSLITSGANLDTPTGLAFTAGGTLIVADVAALVAVNPANGAQSFLTSGGMLSDILNDLAVLPSGELVVASGDGGSVPPTIIGVNPLNGSQRLIASDGFLTWPPGAATDGNGDVLTTSIGPTPQIVRIDPANGAQVSVTSGGFLGAPTDLFVFRPYPALPGDANNDGVVSADDFAAVQTNFGNTGAADGLLPGDANDDGVVSADDFAAIQTNFGNVLGASAAQTPVPEPATGVLLILASAMAMRRRRHARPDAYSTHETTYRENQL